MQLRPLFVVLLVIYTTAVFAKWSPVSKISTDEVSVGLAENMAQCLVANGADVDIAYADRGLAGKSHFDLYYMHSADSGATWEAALQLTKDPETGLFPQLARRGQQVFMTWPGKTQYRYSADGGKTWNPIESLSATGAGIAGFPMVATTPHAVHVIWVDTRLGHKALYYQRQPFTP